MFQRLLERHREELSDADLARPAVVVAPHPDDETLGCGGTIARKRRLGAEVTIAVMTDGSQSHASRMETTALARVRADEVVRAAESLGVPRGSVRLLAYPDGSLARHRKDAVEHMVSLLLDLRPQEVYVPYRREHPADHLATFQIVASALDRFPFSVTLMEYPVWFWYHWPWVSLRLRARRGDARVLANTIGQGMGIFALRELNCAVPIGDVLDIKRAALAEHRSQTSRLNEDPGWAILDDVADGEFARCFFQPYEFFRRSVAGRLR